MATRDDIDKLLAWLREHYPALEADPDEWHRALQAFQPGNLRRGAQALKACRYPVPMTLDAFKVACMRGEAALRAHYHAPKKKPGTGPG